jgi:acyl dehydratase
MPIDPSVAIGADLGDRSFSWSSSDVLLYHLGIGAGSRPGDNLDPDALHWTVDGPSLQVLPSFGVVVPTFHETDPPPLDLPGCDITLSQVVHGSQAVTVHGPLPTSGSATVSTTLTDVWDKGKAAVIWQEGVARTDSGEELWTVRSSIFVRGEGGFGGPRGAGESWALPDRAPDHRVVLETRPEQALLYRLSGDRNPLHADPKFAARGGFSKPILHGLCTYGFTGRALLHALCDGDPGRFRSMSGRFSRPVLPGEPLTVSIWLAGASADGEGETALFQTTRDDGTVLIDRGRAQVRGEAR